MKSSVSLKQYAVEVSLPQIQKNLVNVICKSQHGKKADT